MVMKTCIWCGRNYELRGGSVAAGHTRTDLYCSAKCQLAAQEGKKAAKAAQSAETAKHMEGMLKLIGIIFIALVGLFTILCYKFPKFLKEKNKKLLYAYIIAWVVLIAGVVVYFSFFSSEAVSGIKIKVVSVSCQTEEEFVTLVKEALSKVSVTTIQGDDFAKYSRQARDAVKERNKYDTFKDSVYFVKLPDKVNVYIWFETKDKPMAYVYRINKK